MRILLFALFMVLAPHVAKADPPHSRVQTALKEQPIPGIAQEKRRTTGDDADDVEKISGVDFIPALEGIEGAIRNLITKENEIQRQEKDAREQRDLSAQEAMAKWAMWMFWATLATVILTFAALIAILRTLHHTRRAADYTEGMLFEASKTTAAANKTVMQAKVANRVAKRSADAAIAQANADAAAALAQAKEASDATLAHAKEVFKADYRPFVLFTHAPNADFESNPLFISGETVDICVKNFGRAPSNGVIWGFYTSIVDKSNSGENYKRIDAGFFRELIHVLAPGQEYIFGIEITLSADDADAIRSGKVFFCQVIIIHDHRSEYERKDEIFFCIEADADGGFHLLRVSNSNVWTHEEWRNEEEVRRQNERFEAERRARDNAAKDKS